jgi:hypothetical protein
MHCRQLLFRTHYQFSDFISREYIFCYGRVGCVVYFGAFCYDAWNDTSL